jgi:AraC family transcriptional regulator of adaptative response/methylated-DNA-[protein]-cysteine methyltransferase
VCRIDFGDTPEALTARLAARFPEAKLRHTEPTETTAIAQTLAFLEAPEEGLALPLDVQGTAFQRRVWAALQKIQPGSTASYGQIAAQIGNPNAARAVAQACASNEVAVAIPCHRAVRSNGEMGGYRWGTERKRAILERERAHTA